MRVRFPSAAPYRYLMKKYLILPLLLAITACSKAPESETIPGAKLVMVVKDKGTGLPISIGSLDQDKQWVRGSKTYRCIDGQVYRDTTGNRSPHEVLPLYTCSVELRASEF